MLRKLVVGIVAALVHNIAAAAVALSVLVVYLIIEFIVVKCCRSSLYREQDDRDPVLGNLHLKLMLINCLSIICSMIVTSGTLLHAGLRPLACFVECDMHCLDSSRIQTASVSSTLSLSSSWSWRLLPIVSACATTLAPILPQPYAVVCVIGFLSELAKQASWIVSGRPSAARRWAEASLKVPRLTVPLAGGECDA
jgi:hypothetical protein